MSKNLMGTGLAMKFITALFYLVPIAFLIFYAVQLVAQYSFKKGQELLIKFAELFLSNVKTENMWTRGSDWLTPKVSGTLNGQKVYLELFWGSKTARGMIQITKKSSYENEFMIRKSTYDPLAPHSPHLKDYLPVKNLSLVGYDLGSMAPKELILNDEQLTSISNLSTSTFFFAFDNELKKKITIKLYSDSRFKGEFNKLEHDHSELALSVEKVLTAFE